MRASSGFVRLYIRGIAADAIAAAASFYTTLEAAALAKLTTSQKGKVLTGTASGGTSVEYTLPPVGDLSAQDVAEVASAVLDAADVLIAETPAITDEDLKTALLAYFPSVKSFNRDFRGLVSGVSASEE